jgi:hypothetical protein
MAEERIYADDNVSVTTARIVVSGTTYALRNITSVRMTSTVPSKMGPIAGLKICRQFSDLRFEDGDSICEAVVFLAQGFVLPLMNNS